MPHKEIEVRFLEIDKESLIQELQELGAEDQGEDFLTETIFYDEDLNYIKQHRFIRLRQSSKGVALTYKHMKSEGAPLSAIEDVDEVELSVDDADTARAFLEKLGFVAYRKQEKRRHAFLLDGVMIDIDEWPMIPAYVELDGASEDDLKNVARKLGFDWEDACFTSPREVIEKVYNIPVSEYKYFTFE